VGVRGESETNDDGTPRQDIIKTLHIGENMRLESDPHNVHDRWAVKVLTSDGKQIGFLPSSARDADTVLKGEPITAVIEKLTGGTNWFNRTVLGKKHIGVVLRINKGDVDWDRRERLTQQAKPYNKRIQETSEMESTDLEAAIDAYKKIIDDIEQFSRDQPYASAHREIPAPIERLSMILEKEKRYEEALDVITKSRMWVDPVPPRNKTIIDKINKREARLKKKLS